MIRLKATKSKTKMLKNFCVDEVSSYFDTWPMDSFEVISQKTFCNLAKSVHLADLETDYINL